MRNKKYNLLELRQDREEWASIKTDLWVPEQREQFLKRKEAVDMYIDDFNAKDIYATTGINHDKIAKYVARCLQIDPNTGKQQGYVGLIPYRKVNKKIQTKSCTSASKGAFVNLLLSYPSLDVFIKDNYFGKKNSSLEKRILPSNLHKKFLEECRRLKIQDYEYPFNTTDNAKRTFYKYLRKIEKENMNDAINRENKNVKQKFFSTGIGENLRPVPLTPFSVVQLDGHKIDMLYTVEVINKHGEIIRMPAMRMWLIAVIDVATRVILGYSLTSNENYNQTDILRAIRNSVIPRNPIEFTLSGLKYPDNLGYHYWAIPETSWAIPNAIMLDNAKSHLANNVINKLCSQMYCALNFGSVATPETRGIVERMFKTLEENGYHRTVSTTGSNINDIRRINAEKDAVKFQITYNDIAQLTEYFIAMYNNSPHSALDNQTPLECMRRRIVEAGMQPCIAGNKMKRVIYELTNFTEIKTIRGSFKYGRRPYITYAGVEYRNDILAQSMGLIGKKLIIEVNPDNIKTIKGYFEDGTELGILTAVGEWGRKNHSLKTREEALKLSNYNKQKNNPFYAPLTELENELNERALNERRARTKAARLRVEQDKEITPQENIVNIPTEYSTSNIYTTVSDEEAIQRKRESYTPEELAAIMNAGSLEEAYNQGLL